MVFLIKFVISSINCLIIKFNKMEVETKYYINGREVILVAEDYCTKIYQDISNVDQFYITCYENVVATISKDSINIEEKYQKHELL